MFFLLSFHSSLCGCQLLALLAIAVAVTVAVAVAAFTAAACLDSSAKLQCVEVRNSETESECELRIAKHTQLLTYI